MKYLLFFLTFSAFAQVPQGQSLRAYSDKINANLPEVFDHATKFMKTTVETDNFINFHFLLNATKDEFKTALPKVQNQILSSICSKSREKTVLVGYKASIVYRYENLKGETLGQFMVQPSHCSK